MRRWLSIFLLVLLPAQFSWAAIAAYCGHEADAAVQHFGHHQHPDHGLQHAEEHGNAGTAGGDESAAVLDIDCGHCHCQCTGILVPLARAACANTASGRPAAGADLPSPGHPPIPPERHQWLRLA
jgi:hypothetical protein